MGFNFKCTSNVVSSDFKKMLKYGKVKGAFELWSDVLERKNTLVLGIWSLAFSFPRY